MNLFKNLNFDKLKESLTKTRTKLVNTINEAISGKAVIDDKTLDEIEEILITSDIGYDTAMNIIENTRIRLKSDKDRSGVNIVETVKKELTNILSSQEDLSNGNEIEKYKPYVILIV